MEGFTNVNSRHRHARKTRQEQVFAHALANASIPGALWTDTPLSRCHLPGIPYTYYDEEIVMIRQRTAELIEYQRAEARARARAEKRGHRVGGAPEGTEWYTLEHGGHVQRVNGGEWQGIDE